MGEERETEETREEETQEEHEEEEREEEEEDQSSGGPTAADIAEAIAPKMESIVDRRVTSLMKTLTSDYGLTKQKPEKKTEDDDGARGLAFDSRVLTLAVREELSLNDFDSKEEARTARDLALKIAKQTRLSDLDDPDDVATEIVESVVETMTTMKKTYQTQLRDELKSRGVLRDDDEETEQPSKTKKTTEKSAQEQYDRGAQLARQKYATATPDKEA